MTVMPIHIKQVKPEHITDPVDHGLVLENGITLGDLRKTPELLSGIFTEVVRQFYSANNGLHLNKQWSWAEKPTDSTSQVWINAESVWNDAAPDFRPAIYVALTPITYQATTGRKSSRTGMVLTEAEYTYARIGESNVRFVHIGRTMGETQALLSNTLDLLDAFSDVIRQDFCFRTLAVAQAVPPKVYEKEPRERFRGEVIVNYSFEDTWTLKLESPKLKRVVFEAGLRLANVLGLQPTIM